MYFLPVVTALADGLYVAVGIVIVIVIVIVIGRRTRAVVVVVVVVVASYVHFPLPPWSLLLRVTPIGTPRWFG